MELAETVGNALVITTLVLIVTFIVLFHRWADWTATPMGRHLMVKNILFAAVLGLSSVRIVAGADFDTVWFAWLRAIVFGGVPLVYVGQIYLLWTRQGRHVHRARRAREETRDAADGE